MAKIFISYATGDEDSAGKLFDSLSNLEGVEAYIPERYTHGVKPLAIKDNLDTSDAVVVLLTFNSTNTMWLNQEIGYAFAKNIPIIAIVEQGLDVTGFLEGNEYIIYLRGNFKQNISQVTTKLKSMVLIR